MAFPRNSKGVGADCLDASCARRNGVESRIGELGSRGLCEKRDALFVVDTRKGPLMHMPLLELEEIEDA